MRHEHAVDVSGELRIAVLRSHSRIHAPYHRDRVAGKKIYVGVAQAWMEAQPRVIDILKPDSIGVAGCETPDIHRYVDPVFIGADLRVTSNGVRTIQYGDGRSAAGRTGLGPCRSQAAGERQSGDNFHFVHK